MKQNKVLIEPQRKISSRELLSVFDHFGGNITKEQPNRYS